MPYWLWRAIGGSLMWVSHLFFAFNFYKMTKPIKGRDVEAVDLALAQLDKQAKSSINS